jgi:hypothetical protein
MDIVVVISLLISAVVLLCMWRYYRTARSSENWPCIPGRLLKCELVERSDAGTAIYNLEVRYSYIVDGEVRESENVAYYFGKWSSFRSDHMGLRDALIGMNPLTIYVNPKNPAESVLFPGTSHMTRSPMVLAVFMVLLCPVGGAVAIYKLLFS